jgi:transcriptional regulator GlxA family with amidase domain
MEHLHVAPPAFDRLVQLIHSLRAISNRVSIFRDAEASSDLILGAYVETIATANGPSTGVLRQRLAYRYEVVRRADAAMRRLVGSAYSSASFCKCIGIGERNLELYFREALGVSPKAWFQYLSLHSARTMLRGYTPGGRTVTQVALACGFEHFGRFSESYRRLFGECPSGTLRASASITAATRKAHLDDGNNHR